MASEGAREGLGVTKGGRGLCHKESELQQKETELQATQRELGEEHERAEIVEATLGSERTAFVEANESLKGNLD